MLGESMGGTTPSQRVRAKIPPVPGQSLNGFRKLLSPDMRRPGDRHRTRIRLFPLEQSTANLFNMDGDTFSSTLPFSGLCEA